jgi:hypothetical protein
MDITSRQLSWVKPFGNALTRPQPPKSGPAQPVSLRLR